MSGPYQQQESMWYLHENKLYKLEFRDVQPSLTKPMYLLDGVTDKRISDQISYLVFQEFYPPSVDWCPYILISTIPGATLRVRIPHMQDMKWRKKYKKGFKVFIEDGFPYILFTDYEQLSISYSTKKE